MKALTTLVSAAALAVSISAASLPAHASVFAQFSPVSGSSDYKWVKSGGAGTGGHFFSITAANQTTAHAVAATFSFVDPTYAALALLPAAFTIDATAATGNGAIFNSSAGTWTQTGLNGAFSLIYTGATHTYGSFTVVPGENLLSGSFTNAWIQGSGGSGSMNVTIGNGGSASFTSAVANLSGLVAGSQEFAMNLLAVTPHFGATAVLDAQHHIIGYKAMNSFRASGGGNFAAEGVPEPATWALMILGFGGAGAMLRRRRTAAAVA
jgi:hypothetical protein